MIFITTNKPQATIGTFSTVNIIVVLLMTGAPNWWGHTYNMALCMYRTTDRLGPQKIASMREI